MEKDKTQTKSPEPQVDKRHPRRLGNLLEGRDFTVGEWNAMDNFECARFHPNGKRCQFSTVNEKTMIEHITGHGPLHIER